VALQRRVEQNDVLWMEPVPDLVPEKPDGFAFRVLTFLGPGDLDERGRRRVWVRGMVVNPTMPGARWLQLCVLDDQPLAHPVSAGRFVAPTTEADPARDPRPWERAVDIVSAHATGPPLSSRPFQRPSA
jgi:hypothetical protein